MKKLHSLLAGLALIGLALTAQAQTVWTEATVAISGSYAYENEPNHTESFSDYTVTTVKVTNQTILDKAKADGLITTLTTAGWSIVQLTNLTLVNDSVPPITYLALKRTDKVVDPVTKKAKMQATYVRLDFADFALNSVSSVGNGRFSYLANGTAKGSLTIRDVVNLKLTFDPITINQVTGGTYKQTLTTPLVDGEPTLLAMNAAAKYRFIGSNTLTVDNNNSYVDISVTLSAQRKSDYVLPE